MTRPTEPPLPLVCEQCRRPLFETPSGFLLCVDGCGKLLPASDDDRRRTRRYWRHVRKVAATSSGQ